METKKHFDFLASVILLLFSCYVIFTGIFIHKDNGGFMYVSPALFPLILGIALLICSIMYFLESIKSAGISQRVEEGKKWWKEVFKLKITKNILIGTFIMFIYSYLLLNILPFWIGSFIFMVLLMLFLKSASVAKILFISGTAVGLIVVLFQILFNVPLP